MSSASNSSATGEQLTSRIGDGIVQIRLPMAGNPLRYINGYVLDDEGGLTLIDCGWKADDVFAALEAGLAEHGWTIAGIKRLLITHFHFDHYGLAGTLLRAGVPDLLMHTVDWGVARDHLTDPVAMDDGADAWIAENGFQVSGALDDELMHHRTELAEPTRFLADGDRVGRLRAVHTPGHTPGHLCFVDERSGRMFTGDHVLDPVTPHVGFWREFRYDPLGDYIASLEKVRAIGATFVLPAHGEPFPDLARRVDELLAHEAHREAQVIDALRHGATTAGDVARALPWTRRDKPFTDLTEAHRQFAVAETLAHLEHLRASGTATRNRDQNPITYALTD